MPRLQSYSERSMENVHTQKIGIVQMTVCATLWSIAGIFIKLIDMNPFVLAGFRSLFAAAAVIVYMAVSRQRLVLNRNTWVSGILLCLTFHCFVGATKNTTAANAIVLQYTAPVFILLFSFVFLKKRPRRLDIVAVLLTLAGVSLFFLDEMDGGRMLGNILGLLAGLFMGGMFVAVGNTRGEEKMSGILLGHLLCAAVGIPAAAFTENTFDLRGFAFLFILGVVQLGIPYILYALATNRCSAVTCSIIAAIEPVLNPVWVALFGGEMPGAFAVAGGIFIVAVITVYSVLDHRTTLKNASVNV